ncbi:MAG: ferritin family protein [Acidobacteria bacterium]|nr:ferritin family protein [Acidobacteriota bacterium]
MSKDFAKLKPDEVVQLAIAVEKANARRFETFAEMFESYDPAVSQIFRELLEEERMHRALLERKYEEKFGRLTIGVEEDEVKEVIEAVDLAHAEHFVFDDMTPLDALQVALKAENAARAFYSQLAATTADPDLKRVYDELSEFEADHIWFLEERIGNLAREQTP